MTGKINHCSHQNDIDYCVADEVLLLNQEFRVLIKKSWIFCEKSGHMFILQGKMKMNKRK